MPCKSCGNPTENGKHFCPECLNDWFKMRVVIQGRLTEQYGEATRETLPLMQREMKRLDVLWRRDRRIFEVQANQWYQTT